MFTHPTLARQDSPCPGQGRSEQVAEEVHTALRAIRSPQETMANGKIPPVLSCSKLSSHAAGYKRSENAAKNQFQRAQNKKSPRPWTDPEDCTRFFILTCSPALEGAMANSPGRSSGSWFVLLPVPSHPSNGQWR